MSSRKRRLQEKLIKIFGSPLLDLDTSPVPPTPPPKDAELPSPRTVMRETFGELFGDDDDDVVSLDTSPLRIPTPGPSPSPPTPRLVGRSPVQAGTPPTPGRKIPADITEKFQAVPLLCPRPLPVVAPAPEAIQTPFPLWELRPPSNPFRRLRVRLPTTDGRHRWVNLPPRPTYLGITPM